MASSYSQTVTGLTAGTSYNFRVAAFNSAGTGVVSSPAVVASTKSGTAAFAVSGGSVITPDGTTLLARGINISDSDMSAVSTSSAGKPLLSRFPSLNFVRLACYSYQAPSAYTTFVNQMTALGIIVEFENHQNGAGNGGGAQGVVFTGSALTNESNWYAGLAAAFAGNPYVWFGTNNEPAYSPSIAALSTWHQATYTAIRNTGANNIIMVDLPGGGNPGTYGTGNGMTSSVYAGMRNIVWDFHQYGWVYGGQTGSVSAASMAASMLTNIAEAQTITSADGKIPVICGEYGISTDGQGLDVSGTQLCQAVQANCGVAGGLFGCAAWHWGQEDNFNNLTTNEAGSALTAYGSQVESFIG